MVEYIHGDICPVAFYIVSADTVPLRRGGQSPSLKHGLCVGTTFLRGLNPRKKGARPWGNLKEAASAGRSGSRREDEHHTDV